MTPEPAGRPPSQLSSPAWQRVATTLAFVAAYVALDWVSYVFPIAPFAITPWNPQPGLSLALLIRCGMRFLPALFGAAWLAEIFVRETAPLAAVLAAGAFSLGYGAVGAAMLRWMRFDPALHTLQDLGRFVITAVTGSGAVAALYVILLRMETSIAWADVPGHAGLLWIGDLVGILVVTPFLLVWGPRWRARLQAASRWRWSAAPEIASIPLSLWIVFGAATAEPARFFYVLFVPLVWIAARHGLQAVTAGLLAMQIGLIAAVTQAGYGAASVYELQLLMTTLAATVLALGVAVTGRVSAQSQLDERQRQLDQALRVAAGAELASTLAHELNQPLAAAGNYLQASTLVLSRADPDTGRLRDIVGRAADQVGRATEVVRRLRDFFRSGVIRAEPFELDALVRSVAEALGPRAARCGAVIRTASAAHAVHARGDRLQVELILRNLMGNAIDAIASTGAGSGTIAVGIGTERPGVARVEVHDTGPGVAPADAPGLFDPFRTSKPAGLGLGLAISRSLVEAQGGTLRLEPRAGGATFVFTLPLAERSASDDGA